MLLSLLLAASMWFYVRRILVPFQVADSAVHDRPRGILSDLYPRWFGARELLLHHRDPYSAEVTRDIQAGYYGRPLDPKRSNDPTDQQAFAYPVYVVFLLAPTIKLPFSVIEPAFRWLLVALIVATFWGWMRLLKWRPSPAIAVALLALTLGNFPVVQGILLEQLTLVVSALLAVCLLALAGGNFLLAGCLLAVATIKPQLVWPLAAWLSLWALSDWRRRQRFLWGFGLALLGLLLGAELILPGWLREFRAALLAYRQYTGARSIFTRLTTPVVATIINSLIILAIAVMGWQARKAATESSRFSTFLCLLLAATVVVLPSTALYNQVLLLPATLVLLKNWATLWKSNRLTRIAVAIAAAFVLWPWLSSLALMAASPFVLPATLQKAWTLPLFSCLAGPPFVLLLAVLYNRRADADSSSALALQLPHKIGFSSTWRKK